jgi:DNA-binding MarR family transcriptional regulator
MPEEVQRSILRHFYQINRCMHKQWLDGPGADALTMHQLQALFYIKHEQPVSMHKLAEELHILPGSATLLVDRLVESGWLVRVPDEQDRRSIHLQLSEQARNTLAAVIERRMKQAGSILKVLSAKDLQELDRILGLLENSL